MFLVWLSDAYVEHFKQVRYTCVWNIVLLVFQTMTTLRRDLPLSIQEDMSMHSALSFHRRESHYLNLNNFHFLAEKNESLYSLIFLSMLQTSGYLFRREAWQRTLLGKGRTPPAMAPAHEDQERIYSVWAHWHQHSIIAGEFWHNSLFPTLCRSRPIGRRVDGNVGIKSASLFFSHHRLAQKTKRCAVGSAPQVLFP